MNLRVIKKDIKFLLNDFVSDCILFSDFQEGKKDKEVYELITESLALSNNLSSRVIFPKKIVANEKGVEKIVRMDTAELKAHYKAIQKDLYEGYDQLFEKLSQLAKK